MKYSMIVSYTLPCGADEAQQFMADTIAGLWRHAESCIAPDLRGFSLDLRKVDRAGTRCTDYSLGMNDLRRVAKGLASLASFTA